MINNDPGKGEEDGPNTLENGDANLPLDSPSLNNQEFGENGDMQMEHENGLLQSSEEDGLSGSADHVVVDIDDSPPAGYEDAYMKDVEMDDEGLENDAGGANDKADVADLSVSEDVTNISFGGKYLQEAEKDSETVIGFDSQEAVKHEGDDAFSSYEEIEKNRKLVREELEKMGKMEEEQLKKFKQLNKFNIGNPMFPDLRVSSHHTIAFRLRDNYDPMKSGVESLRPFPASFSSTSDTAFVLMPCSVETDGSEMSILSSEKSLDGSGKSTEEIQKKKKFQTWTQIKKILDWPISSCPELNERINSITNSNAKFNVLQLTIEEVLPFEEAFRFFGHVLPFMANLCLDLPNIVTAPIPLLRRGRNHSISLTQRQIASLLASAFFSTFTTRVENYETFPSVNLDELFSCDPTSKSMPAMVNKIRCILHYFDRMAAEDELHNGIVTFTRKSNKPANLPDWNSSTKKLKELVCLSNGTIETDGVGLLQVDFANKSIGGGVLGRGAVQEEILFVIYPELLISRLFTENLNPGEALLITGCERFSKYSGYASSFTYTGDFFDCTGFDKKGRRLTQIVAIDALYIRKTLTQFNPRLMTRELNKAYVGFSLPERYHRAAIASGKWGCGAFNGNPELKIILQLLAAAEAERDLAVFTFGDTKLQQSLVDLCKVLKDKTVQNIWTLLKQYYTLFCTFNENAKRSPKYSLIQFLMEYLTVGEMDMKDSCCDENTSLDEIKETEVDSSNEKEKKSSTKESYSEEIEFVPNSPAIEESEENVDVKKIWDEVDTISIEKCQSPMTPTKSVGKDTKEKPLSDLYSEPIKTPTKISTLDTTNDMLPLVSEPITSLVESPKVKSSEPTPQILPSSDVDGMGVEEAVTNASGTEDRTEHDISSPSRHSEVKKIITDEDYESVFSPSTFRIPKHPTSKRKLSMSSPQSESRSVHLRKRHSSSDLEVLDID